LCAGVLARALNDEFGRLFAYSGVVGLGLLTLTGVADLHWKLIPNRRNVQLLLPPPV